MTSKIMAEKSNYELYNQAYQYISTRINDTIVKKAIAYEFHFEAGRYFVSQKNWDKAFNHFKEAYRYNPDNYEVQNLLYSTFFASIPQKINNDEGLKEVEDFYYSYEKLQNNPELVEMLLGIYLYMAGNFYSQGNWSAGDSYLIKFEALKDRHPSINFQNSYIISEVYKKPAAHYFKQYNNKKAREYIFRGLKYAPYDYSLKSSLEMMK